ncbi:MAG: PQQ-dependent dehydrogenase, methanol/ethanol family [Candidatus Acidiferrales bacterium]
MLPMNRGEEVPGKESHQVFSTSRISSVMFLLIFAGLGLGCGHGRENSPSKSSLAARRPAAVDAARLSTADKNDPADWLSNGRTYSEQRFSPPKQITNKNVGQLKPAWQFVLNTSRGQEGTPLVVDGVMYVSTAWSEVYALDARTGRKLWYYDPKVPRDWSLNSCCGPINRGIAAWKGKVFVGTLNGHLVALDARTGKPVWDSFTFPSDVEYTSAGTPVPQYVMSGAPRVVKGLVIVGAGGGDQGVRGFVSAYDAETGKLVWRFYTVPGDPSKAFENPALKMAAKTWDGDAGGGGAVWDGISYDPELDLLYFGTGNPAKGLHGKSDDRLFGDSIVAVRPETGEYVWHYQEVPDDVWDYDSTSQLILADIKIGGQARKVIIHAPKDGFVYVIDRATGKLISAKPLFPKVDWATSIDRTTGRPIENPAARRGTENGNPFIVMPGPLGGHSWQAMSYSPLTGFVYIPVMEMPNIFVVEPIAEKEVAQNSKGAEPEWKYQDQVIAKVKSYYSAHLSAWNPVTQREVWHANLKGLWHGGTLATAGNLVFQGTSTGEFSAYQADTGKRLWSISVQTAIIAPPISYKVGADQYVAVAVGWGGSLGLLKGPIGMQNHVPNNLPRVISFKLNGNYSLPPVPAPTKPRLNPPPDTASASQVAYGRRQYGSCLRCHGYWGISAGDVPDLRYSPMVYDRSLLQQVVKGGLLRSGGMPMFGKELSDQQLDAIRAYIIHQANLQVVKNKAERH